MMENNQLLVKKYISKHNSWEKKNVFVIFALQQIPIHLTKTVLKTTSSWLRWIVIDHRKLQVTLLFAYISWKKFCWHTFKASSEGVIVMRFQKMKTKYMKEDMWKSFFRKLAGWHIATSLRINLFTANFQGFILSKWTPSNVYFSLLYKVLGKHLWNSFSLYLLVKILQLVH